ncbi:MAG: tyrosine-type recombinase/integrase [Hydrogenophaga sp.]|uniref:tyrosine-type recombinase/integrase n=1 Tax=Hydrogenophaga sp. TaxID=1904254 RepID=UPI002749C2D8|nr:tyrosine-type recombinase/integrase [Hydrogenophaga sp.]MDP2430559.1 tyrosine-type recombinase/integrase [Pseudomonadota bacterium]MDZ4174659.1 tyrosine-type recombinase/integrase [Hydrogenophaga sp.]
MLNDAVQAYIDMRRACGFKFGCQSAYLFGFVGFCADRGEDLIRNDTAIQWAGQATTTSQRAHRLAIVTRFAQHLRAEDPRHEVPMPVFGPERWGRPVPYILSASEIARLLVETAHYGHHPIQGATFGTLFGLLACTGLRISEATRLRYTDITADGLVIRSTKFRKSRLVALHASARAALERYLQQRRPYAPLDDHVFVSVRGTPLAPRCVDGAFQVLTRRIGLPRGPGLPRATPHSLRHTFAVRSLQACPGERDQVTRHMVALSTYLGHVDVYATYWYLQAAPDLMQDIAQCSEQFVREAS